MDKNTITGFVLIAAVLIGFSIWSQPSAEENAAMARQDSINNVTRQKTEKEKKLSDNKEDAMSAPLSLKDTTALFYDALKGTDKKVILKNDKIELTLGTKGATVEKAVIKGFKDR